MPLLMPRLLSPARFSSPAHSRRLQHGAPKVVYGSFEGSFGNPDGLGVGENPPRSSYDVLDVSPSLHLS